jgi:hypothetical protein
MANCSYSLSPLRQALARSCSAHVIMFETGGVSFNVEKKRRRIQKQQENGVYERRICESDR